MINNNFRLYYENNKVIAYFTWEKNVWDDEFNFETIHLSDIEIAKSEQGKNLSKILINDFLNKFKGKNITLQANTEKLISMYQKYGFELYGDPKETGNLMIKKRKQ